ncbi:hypothetical protein [Deinococcus soli (ex Cha et al. 2016)]|uniref:Uncharacterized protein n=2 Tax=Deinococcus soli (ex Cha et al. 2016) TaxID=1309411 RepID=A0AAE4BL27_9DEIO|nr:hypothetical protein [Deinococcus soli (ex Cha et al. 2016)]MDR6218463.1 hypothetical protein [Deinococcus soli (ex Cha et al. 2016)]MDR6329203.1 hypothetical protein [Deinococcus soli (ex Cha et al. 2016)]MDR6751476.1 hypothetical protein [Deinococcus soli (ex Cha et al. 2016)]
MTHMVDASEHLGSPRQPDVTVQIHRNPDLARKIMSIRVMTARPTSSAEASATFKAQDGRGRLTIHTEDGVLSSERFSRSDLETALGDYNRLNAIEISKAKQAEKRRRNQPEGGDSA